MKYFEYTSLSVSKLGGCVFIILRVYKLQLSRWLNWNFSPACVYMSNCQHDRSDRCYFCIFKNKFVVYKVFKFLLCRSISKLIGGIFTVINYDMSVFTRMVSRSSEKSEFSENTEGTDSSLLCLEVSSICSFSVNSTSVYRYILY